MLVHYAYMTKVLFLLCVLFSPYFAVGIRNDLCACLVKFYAENGVARPENRGGARRSDVHDAKRQAVIQHTSSFTCRASHYARRGAPGRK